MQAEMGLKMGEAVHNATREISHLGPLFNPVAVFGLVGLYKKAARSRISQT